MRSDQANLFCQFENLNGPFARDERFIVGACHNRGTFAESEVNNLFGSHMLCSAPGGRIPKGLRCHPVLTVAAVIVAAKHSEAERLGARKSMKEGFFFDRIHLQSGDVSPRYVQFSVAVEPDAANTVFSGWYLAPMTARKAAYPLAFHRNTQIADSGVFCEEVFQCCRFIHRDHFSDNVLQSDVGVKWGRTVVSSRLSVFCFEPLLTSHISLFILHFSFCNFQSIPSTPSYSPHLPPSPVL